jgi:hypothetical protein
LDYNAWYGRKPVSKKIDSLIASFEISHSETMVFKGGAGKERSFRKFVPDLQLARSGSALISVCLVKTVWLSKLAEYKIIARLATEFFRYNVVCNFSHNKKFLS